MSLLKEQGTKMTFLKEQGTKVSLLKEQGTKVELVHRTEYQSEIYPKKYYIYIYGLASWVEFKNFEPATQPTDVRAEVF